MIESVGVAGATEMETVLAPRIRWGVLGVAGIAVKKVIPALQKGEWTEVVAIASRSLERARGAAEELGIPRAYGSYAELLADPEIDVVYIPLPNHLHVPWTARAAEAGKHVLCEKPLAMNADQARDLLEIRARTGVLIGEAFMVRTSPQWIEAKRLVQEGRIGELRLVSGYFSYFKLDPENIRNRLEYGGGAMMDIGCYPVNLARFLYDDEPRRVVALIERDPDMLIDRLTSVIMDFPAGQATFTCSTQMVAFQQMQLIGTQGRIGVDIPFNSPSDEPTRIIIDDGRNAPAPGGEIVEFSSVDQYTRAGDAFSSAVLAGTQPPVPLEDAIRNMAVIDAIFRSGASGRWEEVAAFA